MTITDTGTDLLKCCNNKTLKYVTLASRPGRNSEEIISVGNKTADPGYVVAKIFPIEFCAKVLRQNIGSACGLLLAAFN